MNQLLKTIKIEKVTVKSYEFFEKIGEYLENEKYANENTQILKEVIHDEPNYLYEIIFIFVLWSSISKILILIWYCFLNIY